MKRRMFLQTVAASAAVSTVASCARSTATGSGSASDKPIKVGILFSQTGGLEIVEKSMSDATLMAIDEINAAGGILGRKLQPVIEDPASDPRIFAEKARKLLLADKVTTVFGCYTGASVKAVLPIFTQQKGLLYYPTYAQGNECPSHAIYTGAVPNQQVSNFIPWIMKNLNAKKFFLVGSNYVFPREMAKVAKIMLGQQGGTVVADEYLPLGHTEWGPLVGKIKELKPDAIFSNVVGDSTVAFYREFKNQGLKPTDIPICSTVTSEVETAAIGPEYATGHYSSFPYFQSIDTAKNKEWVAKVKQKLGDKAVTHHAMECSYWQVFVFKQAAEKAQDLSPEKLRAASLGQKLEAPGGPVEIDPDNGNAWLTPRIGQCQADGQYKIVDEYKEPIKPLPYVAYGESEKNLYCTAAGLNTKKFDPTKS
ncbi:transporter substrate-binding domain-containing protein [Leptolyngbya sp. FACHB-36]|uniref:transporter substrate-binding domain-containing protein n=1 Tax=Leptolyngbya sp. FACHB-36 TaxID=2692808 RepID=UPI001681C207|nr:transporter substrate-binding domain-containing protein [Leptolyngbya sp. FACHB-36]MBD2019883.1 transporter substrate-binding domain-containing protein [Leptolyngbya sp. FACHB-36]